MTLRARPIYLKHQLHHLLCKNLKRVPQSALSIRLEFSILKTSLHISDLYPEGLHCQGHLRIKFWDFVCLSLLFHTRPTGAQVIVYIQQSYPPLHLQQEQRWVPAAAEVAKSA